MLPIVLAGSAAGGPRRPYAIVAGLVATFTLSVLFATWFLDLLGLPSTFLHDLAIALLFVVAAALLVPEIGVALERPLMRLTRRPGGDLGGGLLLGASLGLVMVPCAGPVLAAISVVAASRERWDRDARPHARLRDRDRRAAARFRPRRRARRRI